MIENLIALVALATMEVVLGIDNIVFIAILTGRLPKPQQPAARRTGLLLAMGTRIALLCVLSWMLRLDEPIFKLSQLGMGTSWLLAESRAEANGISCKDLILLGGGLFLIGKAVFEVHEKLEGGHEHDPAAKKAAAGFVAVVVQIALLDIVFSIDSVVTAVGMVDTPEENPAANLWVMIVAIVIAVGVMLVFAEQVSAFIERHPTLKMLALSFLILIGVMLVAEAIGTPINKGYIYFAMAFALLVEILNLRVRSLRHAAEPTAGGAKVEAAEAKA